MFRGTAALSLLLACASALQLPGGGMPAGLTIPAGLSSATTPLGIDDGVSLPLGISSVPACEPVDVSNPVN